MKAIFCPRCHKRIIPPSFLKSGNIQGNIKLSCGDNTCKGVLNIKKKKEETENG